jgi:TPR repeat protein
MSYYGNGVAQDYAEALRLFQLAAAQGHPEALYYVAKCHECGFGVTGNQAEGISWYRRAQAAGYYRASYDLRRLRA